MALPPSVVKFSQKSGQNRVEFISSVDRVQYSIRELTLAALRDVGKYIARECNLKAKRTLRGFAHNPSKRVSTMLKKASFSYWARSRECDLQVGIRHGSWYGIAQELGSAVCYGRSSGKAGVPGPKGATGQAKPIEKLGILRNTTYDSIPMIRKIEAQYLSAISYDEAAVEQLLARGGGDDDL